MENITIELYIIAYTFLGVGLLYLYSLPLRLITKSVKGIKDLFNNNRWWKMF